MFPQVNEFHAFSIRYQKACFFRHEQPGRSQAGLFLCNDPSKALQ